jgi:NitT/TauT family transport system substrate-binding protein
MRLKQTQILIGRMIGFLLISLTLTACDSISQFTSVVKDNVSTLIDSVIGDSSSDTQKGKTIRTLKFGISPRAAWMPWFFKVEESKAENNPEGILHYTDYKVNIQIVKDSYAGTIESFINKEIDAVVITNIDAIAQLVRQDIEADVIMVVAYSNGNDAILVPLKSDLDLREKTLALTKFSTRHYLLERYLMREQINPDEVNIVDASEEEIPGFFENGTNNSEVQGVVTSNPNIDKIVKKQQAKILFDSYAVSQEIVDFVVIHREVLQDYPGFAQAILSAWFSVMETLQGSRRGSTVATMAQLSGVSREQFDAQMESVTLNDTPFKALSAMRDRSIKKTMRYIRYFMERHQLTGDEPFSNWISYPGRTPAVLHLNAKPLQEFVAPTGVKY